MPEAANILIVNARVFTANPAMPYADAVAIHGARIGWVGSNTEAALGGGQFDRTIDAGGGSLLPGFIDSHFHLLWGAIESADAQLSEVANLDELALTIRAFASEFPKHEWLVGRGLYYTVVPAGRSLTRHDLDACIADRPLIVFANDTHIAWANTIGLERAGILHGGEAGPNSEIVMGEDGLASGELREPGARKAIMNLIPEPDDVGKRALLRKALARASSMGITSLHNMNGSAEELALYAALDDLGELPLRVYAPYSATPETPIEALKDAVALRDMHPSGRARGGMVKFFMDGVIEGYTALMLDDYADLPGNKGGANFNAEHFNRMAIEADRLGLQIAVHAIGDAAVRRTLDGFEAAIKANGKRDSRHRIEHIETIHPYDIPRFAELGVIASMQPLHSAVTLADPYVMPQRVGKDRWPTSFAWQTLREAGARLVFGSDWPVVTQNPMKGLYAALNRQPWERRHPEQKQTLENALIAYTRDAAYAEFQEGEKGQIKAGMLADLVLLPVDIFEVPAAEIGDVRPVMTISGGRVVFEA